MVVYILTIGLVIYSSLYLLVKLALFALVAILLRTDWINRRPNNSIKEIQFIASEWKLLLHDGTTRSYKEAQVLIYNVLFQLIQFACGKEKKLIVLFHDQIPQNQLRLLNLKIVQN